MNLSARVNVRPGSCFVVLDVPPSTAARSPFVSGGFFSEKPHEAQQVADILEGGANPRWLSVDDAEEGASACVSGLELSERPATVGH